MMPGSAEPSADLLRLIEARAAGRGRMLVALAGPPGVGKSMLSEALGAALGPAAAIVPMDGFHFDDAVLSQRGLLARKGAPDTFDVDGLACTLERLRRGGRDVAVPVFDRSTELSRAAGRIVPRAARIVLVEGNYLLLDQAPWRELAGLFDLKFFLDAEPAELRRRLLARWLEFGYDEIEARRKVEDNDLQNAALVLARRLPADMILDSSRPALT